MVSLLTGPDLRGYWDFRVLLETAARAQAAWLAHLHSNLPDSALEREAELEQRRAVSRRQRYVGGQALYYAEATPRAYAHLVIDNNDLGLSAATC